MKGKAVLLTAIAASAIRVVSAPSDSTAPQHKSNCDQQVCFDPAAGRITFGDSEVSFAPGGDELRGIRHQAAGELWSDRAATTMIARSGATRLEDDWKLDETRAHLSTNLIARGSALEISQSASSTSSGIKSVRWGLIVPDTYDLILPVLGGIKLSSSAPEAAYGFRRFDYPNVWEAQMFLVQSARGGLLVHADDNAQSFKSLYVTHKRGNFYVVVESHFDAPFDRNVNVISPKWTLTSYAGSWTKGAGDYVAWSSRSFGLGKLASSEPAWTKKIRFSVVTNLQSLDLLRALAKRTDAHRTLLVIPDWRRYAYDTHYPDYSPKPFIAKRIRQAHALGFKVMLYTNIFGVDPQHPEFSRMQQFQVRDSETGQPVWSEYTAGSKHVKFAQIDPAAKSWRSLFIRRIEKLVSIVNPDAIHLDQSLLMYNDANGRIDGMNMMEGNLALHRELRAGLPPSVALGGESLNELTMRYEAFAQRHAYGIFAGKHSWDDKMIDQIVPLSTALFYSQTIEYAHPDEANPITPQYYMAWHRVVHNRLGAIPTLTRPTISQIERPDSLTQQLFREAGWFERTNAVPYFTDWKPGTLSAYLTCRGSIFTYRKVPLGEALLPGQR